MGGRSLSHGRRNRSKIVTDHKGLAVFDLIRGHRPSEAAVLCAFDLLELDGEDLRRMPIETRKSTLKSLLRSRHAVIAFNAHFIADGAIVYRQACALGCEGIVSKRLGLAVSLGPDRSLGESQKPGGSCYHARGRGRLEPMIFAFLPELLRPKDDGAQTAPRRASRGWRVVARTAPWRQNHDKG